VSSSLHSASRASKERANETSAAVKLVVATIMTSVGVITVADRVEKYRAYSASTMPSAAPVSAPTTKALRGESRSSAVRGGSMTLPSSALFARALS
jgi:hypothetical protein